VFRIRREPDTCRRRARRAHRAWQPWQIARYRPAPSLCTKWPRGAAHPLGGRGGKHHRLIGEAARRRQHVRHNGIATQSAPRRRCV
jgi:hypothetical protein